MNTSNISANNLKRSVRSNIRSNLRTGRKSEIVSKHFTNIEKDNEDLMNSLENLGKDKIEKREAKKSSSPMNRRNEDKRSVNRDVSIHMTFKFLEG